MLHGTKMSLVIRNMLIHTTKQNKTNREMNFPSTSILTIGYTYLFRTSCNGKKSYEVVFTSCTTLCLYVRHCSTRSMMTSCFSPCISIVTCLRTSGIHPNSHRNIIQNTLQRTVLNCYANSEDSVNYVLVILALSHHVSIGN